MNGSICFRAYLLPGWLAKACESAGYRLRSVTLSMSARQEGTVMRVLLETGLRNNTPLEVDWPGRRRPVAVTVDGQGRVDYSADGIRLERPFRELVAHW
jgi:riboflavin biosynthesis pyrimidine reductase